MQTYPSPIARRVNAGLILSGIIALCFGGMRNARGENFPEANRSPVNQVFQWVETGTCTLWTSGTPTTATAYLWIPENCKRVRGLLILCSNVPEHMLVGHPAIRKVCADNDLGIVWCVKSFYNFQAKAEGKTDVAFLNQLLDGLAKKSGYDEVASVPWIPMGESGHLLMVDALVENAPERCIAGVWMKNNHLPPHNRVMPACVVFGSAQEWSQDKGDIRTIWNKNASGYENVINERKNHPDWPLTYSIDGSSGHFDCSEKVAQFFAHYIDAAAKARLPRDGSTRLKPVSLDTGYLADMPVPGHENHPVTAFSRTPPDARAVPWFFDEESAKAAQEIAHINWSAETQFPAFADNKGNIFPYTFNGITLMPINKPQPPVNGLTLPTIETEADGITFKLKGVLLDKIPSNFVGAGQPLAKGPSEPSARVAMRLRGTARWRKIPHGAGSHLALADLCGGPGGGNGHDSRRGAAGADHARRP